MPPQPTLTVAIAQMQSVLGDPDANLTLHLDRIAEARARGADVLLFPEMSLTGHSAGSEALRLALPGDDPRIQRIAEASGEMCTVFGLIEEAVAAQFYNSAIAVQGGRTVFVHRKINLATYGLLDDGKHFAEGRYVETFDIKGWRTSVLICNDVYNPGLAHLAALHGAVLLLVPISSALEAVGSDFDNPQSWALAGRFYAMAYGWPVLVANRVGREGDLTFWGGSTVWDAQARAVAQAGDSESVLVTTIAYDDVRKARFALPTVRDSNLDLIQREVNRLSWQIGVPPVSRKV